jgi:hypothetical protein
MQHDGRAITRPSLAVSPFRASGVSRVRDSDLVEVEHVVADLDDLAGVDVD